MSINTILNRLAQGRKDPGLSRKIGASDLPKSMERLAIIVVTYKRQELLAQLFDSIRDQRRVPWRVIVVDNEASEQTAQMAHELHDDLRERAQSCQVLYVPQERNLGGAGGFHAGVEAAYEAGAQWFWVMDDDVALEPDAIERLEPWTRKFPVIQPSRFDADGGAFYWQYHVLTPLAIPNPIAPAGFGERGYHTMNTMCFEGALFCRAVVERIGLPDQRFFIYWDDTIYGYLAAKVCTPVVIADTLLRRTRQIDNWDIAGVRQLNSTSDMNRFHIMRNRGHMARYLMMYGDYHPACFALGTVLTFVKECIRLVAVDRKHVGSGLWQLLRGAHQARKILRDQRWIEGRMDLMVDSAGTAGIV